MGDPGDRTSDASCRTRDGVARARLMLVGTVRRSRAPCLSPRRRRLPCVHRSVIRRRRKALGGVARSRSLTALLFVAVLSLLCHGSLSCCVCRFVTLQFARVKRSETALSRFAVVPLLRFAEKSEKVPEPQPYDNSAVPFAPTMADNGAICEQMDPPLSAREDVRFTAADIFDVEKLLDFHEVVEPQEYLDPRQSAEPAGSSVWERRGGARVASGE